MTESMDRGGFLNLAGVTEGSLLALAFLLGWLTGVDPVEQLRFEWNAFGLGVLATAPLFVLFLVCYRLPIAPLQKVRDLLIDMLAPLLDVCRWFDLVLLALLAGLCEEILFRGTLQLWLSQWGPLTAIAGASILFGLAHCVTATYAIVTAVIGVYLSWTMTLTEEPNLLIPITAHAVYDYVAFLVLLADYRRRGPTPADTDGVDDGDVDGSEVESRTHLSRMSP